MAKMDTKRRRKAEEEPDAGALLAAMAELSAAEPNPAGLAMAEGMGIAPGAEQAAENSLPEMGKPDAKIEAALYGGITEEDIREARGILAKYKSGKSNLESRIIENEQWWKRNHWESLRKQQAEVTGQWQPTSAWTFNSVSNKHADAMDNYPEPNVLPREQSDSKDAHALGEIIPVILERSNFEQTYSSNWWYKLKHGVCAYGAFWNSSLENGLGDIDIRDIDLLKLFWEPGITDIQSSRHLFVVDYVDQDILEETYPQLKTSGIGNDIDIGDYIREDSVDYSGKCVVVDWYYKKPGPQGGMALHYCKFVGDEILFSSENDPENYPDGWYAHGQYPIVLDVLYPEAGTPVGFGIIDICKDPQMTIDMLCGNMLEMSYKASKPRFWIKKGCGVNAEQFLKWDEPLVEVEGDIDEERVRQINLYNMDSEWMDLLQHKVSELKETSSNRDVSQGSSGGGVTAASAIAALQEAGNKGSRDMISASYRAYTKLVNLTIELIRQFYDEQREFRILAPNAEFDYVKYSNASIKDRVTGQSADGGKLFRKPIFDIRVKPQKRSTYSKLAQNELAKELFAMGAFNSQMAQQIMPMVEMMDFDGKDAVLKQISEGMTLAKENAQLKQALAQMTGGQGTGSPGGAGQMMPSDLQGGIPGAGMGGGMAAGQKIPIQQAQQGGARTALTDTGKKIAASAQVSPGRGGGRTAVR